MMPALPDGLDAEVIIVGGGPCGLVLAQELGRRGIATLLLSARHGTTSFPQANATQARTMEHFRRLGLADRIRALGLPPDYRTDVAYLTRLTGYELARIAQPSSAEAASLAARSSGKWSVAELPHRCSQLYIEPVLLDGARRFPSVELRFGAEVVSILDDGDTVVATARQDGVERAFRARFLVGADGPRSRTRAELGLRYEGQRDHDRAFLVGSMFSVYFRSSDLYRAIPGRAKAWQYWIVNPSRRGLFIALDGVDSFVFMSQLAPDEDADGASEQWVRALVEQAVGAPIDIDVLETTTWAAGLTLVAEDLRVGRAFLAGDAAHLFTPTGGLGYNTAVDDAVNLGWKLAAVVHGWGGEGLLASYVEERRPAAWRNVMFARGFAESVGGFTVPAEIEEASAGGDQARNKIGRLLGDHAKAEFDISGITLGMRYDDSRIIVGEGVQPPPDDPNTYIPTAVPGGRAPHAWLSDGRSLYDAFGLDFTLLVLAAPSPDVSPLTTAADARGIPMTVLDVSTEGLREIYNADLAIVRPDQVVCWRGDEVPQHLDPLLNRISGWAP